jgi:hypothetical protein
MKTTKMDSLVRDGKECEEMGDIMILERMYCGKKIYSSKKLVKKSAKHLNRVRFGDWGAKYSTYHCKSCQGWHIYTENKQKLRSNKQHSRGGRR